MSLRRGKENTIQSKRIEEFLNHQDVIVLPFQRMKRKGLGMLRVHGLNFAAKFWQVPLGLFQFGATHAPFLPFSV